ncbi:unnamed protein product, partial [Allacma fusca]
FTKIGKRGSKMEKQEQALQPTEENDSESITPSSSLNSPTVQTEITTYTRPITSGFDKPHPLETEDLETAFTITFSAAEKLLTELLNIHGNLRVEVTVGVTMEMDLVLNEEEISTKTAAIYLKSKNHDLYGRTGIEDLV